MPESIVRETTDGGVHPPAFFFLRGIVLAATLGAFVSLLDFALFEIYRNRPVVFELIFAKPNFLGLSYLSCHVLTFILIAVLAFCCVFLVTFLLRLLHRFFRNISVSFISLTLFCLLIVSMRIKRIIEQPLFTSIFLIIVLLLIGIGFRRLQWPKFAEEPRSILIKKLSRWLLFSTFVSVSVVFIAPDAYDLFSRNFGNDPINDRAFPNIILVVLDTVRADHISSYGYTNNRTPNLDRLSRGGLHFLKAYSTSPWTVPSHASMFTGLLTSQHHADWGHTYLDEDHLTVAEFLRDLGYRTAGFSENPNITKSNGFAQGFNEFHDTWRVPLFSRVLKKANSRLHFRQDRHEFADRTLGLLRRWIRNSHPAGSPSFAFLNLMAAHLPRYPRTSPANGPWSLEDIRRLEPINLIPERYYLDQYKVGSGDFDIMRDVYDQEISFLDERIGDLVAFLSDQHILDSSVLIVTSDHGELFGEHGFIEHQLCLYEPVLRVPFIIIYPGVITPRIIETRVSTSALFSTLTDIIGLSENELPLAMSSMTKSVFREPEINLPIIAEYANGLDMIQSTIGHEAGDFDFSQFDQTLKTIIFDRYKYTLYSTGKEELFDLLSDPDEKHDLTDDEGSLAGYLRHMLAEATEGGRHGENLRAPPPADAATLEALRALGYID